MVVKLVLDLHGVRMSEKSNMNREVDGDSVSDIVGCGLHTLHDLEGEWVGAVLGNHEWLVVLPHCPGWWLHKQLPLLCDHVNTEIKDLVAVVERSNTSREVPELDQLLLVLGRQYRDRPTGY